MVFTSPAWSTSRGKVSWSDNAQTGVSRQNGIRNWKQLLLAEGRHRIGNTKKKKKNTFYASNLTMSLQNVNPCELLFFFFSSWKEGGLSYLGRGENGWSAGPDGCLQRAYALRKGTCINDVMYLYKDITLTCNDSSFSFLMFSVASFAITGHWALDPWGGLTVWKDVVCFRVDSSGI